MVDVDDVDVGVCMCDICGVGCVLSCCAGSSELSWFVISNELDIPESSSLSVATTGNSCWHCSVGMKFVAKCILLCLLLCLLDCLHNSADSTRGAKEIY